MICPECEKENKKSIVVEEGSSKTLMACLPFFDTNGDKHLHDSNIITTKYRCSNGHCWIEKKSGECWCGWKGKVFD